MNWHRRMHDAAVYEHYSDDASQDGSSSIGSGGGGESTSSGSGSRGIFKESVTSPVTWYAPRKQLANNIADANAALQVSPAVDSGASDSKCHIEQHNEVSRASRTGGRGLTDPCT